MRNFFFRWKKYFFLYFENDRFILIHFFSKLMTMNENDKTLKNIYLIWLNTRNEELPSGAEDWRITNMLTSLNFHLKQYKTSEVYWELIWAPNQTIYQSPQSPFAISICFLLHPFQEKKNVLKQDGSKKLLPGSVPMEVCGWPVGLKANKFLLRSWNGCREIIYSMVVSSIWECSPSKPEKISRG